MKARSDQSRETPPRAWGRLRIQLTVTKSSGNTPTGVGKTYQSSSPHPIGEKHPHGRGEDLRRFTLSNSATETPPRAWGRLGLILSSNDGGGNTPTGVGKTHHLQDPPCRTQKHPHGRGEDDNCRRWSGLYLETPPRAWGRLQDFSRQGNVVGNTPTGVGKTEFTVCARCHGRKHPHGRGEDENGQGTITGQQETPPRAWGRPFHLRRFRCELGNTPTGVGKTRS